MEMADETISYTPFGGSREIGMNMYAYGFKKNNKTKYGLNAARWGIFLRNRDS